MKASPRTVSVRSRTKGHPISAYFGLVLLAGCQTLPHDGPASLDLDDPAARAVVSATLAQALGRAQVTLGPSGDGPSSVVSVLPPAPSVFETHALAIPTLFDLRRHDGVCVAVRRDTGQAYPLPRGACLAG